MRAVWRARLSRAAGSILPLAILVALLQPFPVTAQPAKIVDLRFQSTSSGLLQRVYGSQGTGSLGVPVAGGYDMDGDGHTDYAIAAMTAAPGDPSRNLAGVIYLVFGDGTIGGALDTAAGSARILEIHGEQAQENAGNSIWMAEVTGDSLGDLIIGRQNHSYSGRTGSGAVTIIPGQAALRTMAGNDQDLELDTDSDSLGMTTLVGASTGDRLGIWLRNGDVDGDGQDDFAVAADRMACSDGPDCGAVYVVRGGAHLVGAAAVDLANFGTTALPGNIARVTPPPATSGNYHFGATLNLADLDGNDRAELIVAATLNRAGAILAPTGGSGKGLGGAPRGRLYIAWDDNFPGDWSTAPDFVVDAGSGSHTTIDGGDDNDNFGEELLGGLDYDDDDTADLFIGDLTADALGGVARVDAGAGYVLYNAATLKDEEFDMDDPPDGLVIAAFLGPVTSAIGADTAMHGDFDGDGIDDLAFASPHDRPFGRINAGSIHVVVGQDGIWPAFSDLAPGSLPPTSAVRIVNIHGANGNQTGDTGDTLAYSGAMGDINSDGAVDIITNEMVGNGFAPGTIDVGNLILLDGARLLDLTVGNEICFPVVTATGPVATICLQ